jgi:hypothetical protein
MFYDEIIVMCKSPVRMNLTVYYYHLIQYLKILRYIKVDTARNTFLNPLNAELNLICHLLALLGAHPILHVSRIRVNVICSI